MTGFNLHKRSISGNEHATDNSMELFFYPKQVIRKPNGLYEQEADAMTDKVMRMKLSLSEQNFFSSSFIQRKCAHCEEEKKIQRKKVMHWHIPLVIILYLMMAILTGNQRL